jgi:Monogalactosyldiacylglycerol (MGDG) synthase
LVFALPMSARWFGISHPRWKWVAAFAVTAGVTMLVLLMRPNVGRSAAESNWEFVLVVGGIVVAGAAIAATRISSEGNKAILLAFGAGCAYGVTAALTKSVLVLWPGGIRSALFSWQTITLAATSICGLIMSQVAFRQSSLNASLPMLTISQRVVGAGLGIVVFGDHLPLGPVRILLMVGAITLAGCGIAALARQDEPQIALLDRTPQRLSAGAPQPVRRLAFLYADTGGGHRASALAVKQVIEKQFGSQVNVELIDPTKRNRSPLIRLSDRLYSYGIKYSPWIWAAIFHSANRRVTVWILRHTVLRSLNTSLKLLCTHNSYDAVVSFHPLLSHPAVRLVKNTPGAVAMTVVTDLFEPHAAWAHTGVDTTFVPNRASAGRLARLGVKPERMQCWLAGRGPVFGPDYSTAECRCQRSAVRSVIDWRR